MQFFVGIDVSLDSSSICVIDERGVIIKEGKTDSDPAAIARFIRGRYRFPRVMLLTARDIPELLTSRRTDSSRKSASRSRVEA